jgi:glutaminyl-peptide cyclotransferase
MLVVVVGIGSLLAVACSGSAEKTHGEEPDEVVVEEPVDVVVEEPADSGVNESSGDESSEGDVVYRVLEVVNTYDHDEALYTQGLEFVDGMLLESGGRWGESVLRIYDPETGAIAADHRVDDDLFAEGATVHDGRVWQLTWLAETALVYELDDLKPVEEVPYRGEGWGLCLLGDRFVMSNGSDQLTFRRTDDFSPSGSTAVALGAQPIMNLNELECVTIAADGSTSQRVWANAYQSNLIYGIDPASGQVTDVVDASDLVPPGFEGDLDRVLNGIAYNPESGNFWLTGKNWPLLYEVRFR